MEEEEDEIASRPDRRNQLGRNDKEKGEDRILLFYLSYKISKFDTLVKTMNSYHTNV